MAAALAFLFAVFLASGQEPAHPLKPADRSSPRAALKTFLDSGDALGTFLAKDYLPSPTHAEFQRLVALGDAAVESLNLFEVAPATRARAAARTGLPMLPRPPPARVR